MPAAGAPPPRRAMIHQRLEHRVLGDPVHGGAGSMARWPRTGDQRPADGDQTPARASHAHPSLPTPTRRRTAESTSPPDHRQRHRQDQDVEVGSSCRGRWPRCSTRWRTTAEGRRAPRAPMACMSNGHQTSSASSTRPGPPSGAHRRHMTRRPPRHPALSPSGPTDLAATRTIRAIAVTSPSFLDEPGHQDEQGGGRLRAPSDRTCSPKAAAPTAANDQIGSA